MSDFLEIQRGGAPLIVTFPHGGTEIPGAIEQEFRSPWLARKDSDWWIAELYSFVEALGATTIRTRIGRSVIDCNRDPSGASLYPGQATTELCPTTSFDGEPLYRGDGPDSAAIAARRERYFDPYHTAIRAEIERLRGLHPCIVLYDAHSIRSRIPRLFDGALPQFNIGTNGGATCAAALTAEIERRCAASGLGHVVDGRFKGGWTVRHHAAPDRGIHAVQMELAMRGYCDEPDVATPDNWPAPLDAARAAPLTQALEAVLRACLTFATTQRDEP